MTRTTAVIALLSTLPLAQTLCGGDQRVTVRLTGGRELTAQVDERTDASRLWLRFGDDRVVLRRSLDWSRIEAASRDGRAIAIEQLLEMAHDDRAASTSVNSIDRFSKINDGRQQADQAATLLGLGSRIARLESHAVVERGGDDANDAGWLLVHVYARDEAEWLVGYEGIVELDLTVPGERRIARWVREARVTSEDPVLLLKLPLDLPQAAAGSSHGTLRLRLRVPGQGVFEHAARVDGIGG